MMPPVILASGDELRFYAGRRGLHLMVWREDRPLTCRQLRQREIEQLVGGGIDSIGISGLVLQQGAGGVRVFARKREVGVVAPDVLRQALLALDAGDLPPCPER